MLSILVCHTYFLGFDQKQQQRAKPYPPLATLQVAALLRTAGHEVSLFDAMLAEDYTRFERQLDLLHPQVVLFYEDNYNFLSKMCLGRMRRAGCDMLDLAQRRGARSIVGGSDASDAPEPYLSAGADAVLYSIGFVVATGCLHAAGIAIGLIHRWPTGKGVLRAMGAVVALAGLWFLWQAVA